MSIVCCKTQVLDDNVVSILGNIQNAYDITWNIKKLYCSIQNFITNLFSQSFSRIHRNLKCPTYQFFLLPLNTFFI